MVHGHCRAVPVGDGVCDVREASDPPARASHQAIIILQLLRQQGRGRGGRGAHLQGPHQVRLMRGQGDGVSGLQKGAFYEKEKLQMAPLRKQYAGLCYF